MSTATDKVVSMLKSLKARERLNAIPGVALGGVSARRSDLPITGTTIFLDAERSDPEGLLSENQQHVHHAFVMSDLEVDRSHCLEGQVESRLSAALTEMASYFRSHRV